MPKYLTQEEAFMKCEKEGRFIVTEEIDKEKIRSTINIADADVASADLIKKKITKQSNHARNIQS
mgnify:FL=1